MTKIINKSSYNNSGFTLAETLITLVIVGIIAAITIPSLVAQYVERQTVSKVKKAYSVIGQAYNRAIADNGPANSWSDTNKMKRPSIIASYFKPFLSYTKWGCQMPCSPWYDEVHYLNGTDTCAFLNNYFIVFMTDGSVLLFGANPSWDDFCVYSSTYQAYSCGSVWVDINGYAKPNVVGKDIFSFTITTKGLKPTLNVSGVGNHDCAQHNHGSSNGYGRGTSCATHILRYDNMKYL